MLNGIYGNNGYIQPIANSGPYVSKNHVMDTYQGPPRHPPPTNHGPRFNHTQRSQALLPSDARQKNTVYVPSDFDRINTTYGNYAVERPRTVIVPVRRTRSFSDHEERRRRRRRKRRHRRAKSLGHRSVYTLPPPEYATRQHRSKRSHSHTSRPRRRRTRSLRVRGEHKHLPSDIPEYGVEQQYPSAFLQIEQPTIVRKSKRSQRIRHRAGDYRHAENRTSTHQISYRQSVPTAPNRDDAIPPPPSFPPPPPPDMLAPPPNFTPYPPPPEAPVPPPPPPPPVPEGTPPPPFTKEDLMLGPQFTN